MISGEIECCAREVMLCRMSFQNIGRREFLRLARLLDKNLAAVLKRRFASNNILGAGT
jgi:hypothetical protein